jgi:ferredoxin
MSEYFNRLPENVPGEFYVSDQCLDCDFCREVAPTVFRRLADQGVSVVYSQPGDEATRAAVREAMEGCAVEAIRREG